MSTFAELIHSVKPKARSPLYVILCACLSLKAQDSPVATKDIAAVLKELPGLPIPANLTSKLRRYSNYLHPVKDGREVRWQLSPAGVQKLEKLGSFAVATAKVSRYLYDVAVICALETPEFDAVAEAFGGKSSWRELGDASYTHSYRETQITARDGTELKVVGCTSTSMGLTAAAIAATQLVLRFKPKIVVMVGIAAGTRDGGKEFGDVLVADPSVDYNSGKVEMRDGIRGFSPDPYPIGLNARLRSVLQRYRGKPDIFEDIRKKWHGKLPISRNRLHIGPLGAADQVIDDASRILEIKLLWRKLIGVEMETYGVYRACHEAPEPKPKFVSFKAVCDFAAEKTDSWQAYASFIAAEFSMEFLKREWSSIWPKENK